MLIGSPFFIKTPNDLDFFFPTPTYPPLRLKEKQNDSQPSWPLDEHSENPLSLGGWTAAAATPPGSHTPGGHAPSLARPLQGSDQQLVALLCRNRRHPGSLRSSVDHKPVAAVSKLKAQPQRSKEKNTPDHQPTHNFRRPGAFGARLLPSTSGRRTRFLSLPATQLRN